MGEGATIVYLLVYLSKSSFCMWFRLFDGTACPLRSTRSSHVLTSPCEPWMGESEREVCKKLVSCLFLYPRCGPSDTRSQGTHNVYNLSHFSARALPPLNSLPPPGAHQLDLCVCAGAQLVGVGVPVGCALWGHAPNLSPAHQIFRPTQQTRSSRSPASTWSRLRSPLARTRNRVCDVP